MKRVNVSFDQVTFEVPIDTYSTIQQFLSDLKSIDSKNIVPNYFNLQYIDFEGDVITITTTDDLQTFYEYHTYMRDKSQDLKLGIKKSDQQDDQCLSYQNVKTIDQLLKEQFDKHLEESVSKLRLEMSQTMEQAVKKYLQEQEKGKKPNLVASECQNETQNLEEKTILQIIQPQLQVMQEKLNRLKDINTADQVSQMIEQFQEAFGELKNQIKSMLIISKKDTLRRIQTQQKQLDNKKEKDIKDRDTKREQQQFKQELKQQKENKETIDKQLNQDNNRNIDGQKSMKSEFQNTNEQTTRNICFNEEILANQSQQYPKQLGDQEAGQQQLPQNIQSEQKLERKERKIIERAIVINQTLEGFGFDLKTIINLLKADPKLSDDEITNNLIDQKFK